MSAFFLESSALVKRYNKEAGTSFVITLLKPSAGNQLYVARIALVEVVSALTRQHRAGNIDARAFNLALSRFRRVFVAQFRVINVETQIIEQASLLAEKHALRGYDAVQLAAAREIHLRRKRIGALPLTLISADNALNLAASSEGLLVDNPNNYP